MRVSVRGPRGFTFVELLTVVFITGILAAIAVPRFADSLSHFLADSLARRIVADLDTVRQAARAASTAKTFTIDTNSRSYTLGGVAHPDRSGAAYTVSLADYSPAAQFATVDLGGDMEIAFNGFGYPDSGGTVVIVVGNHPRTIRVDAQTGQATVP